MADLDAKFFSVDLSNEKHLEFKSFDEIANWVQQERAAWDWLLKPPGQTFGPKVEELQNAYRQNFQALTDRLQEWKREPNLPERVQALHKQFSRGYSVKSNVLLSTHSFAEISSQIAASSNPQAGLAALAYLLKIPVQPANGAAVEGITRAILIGEGIDSKAPVLVTNTIKKLVEDREKQSAQHAQEFSVTKSAAESFLKDSKDEFQKQIESQANDFSNFSARSRSEIADAIKSIRDTEDVYTKKMQLQASVDYWRGQSTTQGKNAKTYLKVLLSYVVVVGVAGILLARRFLPLLLTKNIGTEPEFYAVFLTLTLLATTIVFWAARVIVRLYLSAHHLTIDADERVVMAQTYLALINEGKLDPQERTLVLTPLFRPSADGIVKDEAAPDFSTAALLSRFLDRK
jgi:molybdopterin-biosynthesis enzyme MoeA-like protein